MIKLSPMKFHLCVTSELKPTLQNCSEMVSSAGGTFYGLIIRGPEGGVEREKRWKSNQIVVLIQFFIETDTDTIG